MRIGQISLLFVTLVPVYSVFAESVASRPTASQPATASRPVIRISYETTRITQPLKPDGTPDYLAALNEEYGRGVTKDNNAAVKILQALGPECVLEDSVREKALAAVGFTPAEHKPLADAVDIIEEHEKGQLGPWTERDYPKLAGWLRENKEPLDKLVSASQCPRYFIPNVSTDLSDPSGWGCMPKLGSFRHGAKCLAIRANLEAGAGDFDLAGKDLMAAYRLGNLLTQDTLLVSQLVASGVKSFSTGELLSLVASGKLNASQSRRLLAELRDSRSAQSVSEVMDRGERYLSLAAIIRLARNPSGRGLDEMMGWSMQGKLPVETETAIDKAVRMVEWNDLLHKQNTACDETIVAMRLPTFAQRYHAWGGGDPLKKTLLNLNKAELLKKYPPPVKPDSAAATAWLNELMRNDLRILVRAQILADLADVQKDLTIVSLALSAYRAEKGKYPDRLDALSPDYLKQVPADFCSGKPFIYKPQGDGYVLYSAGENMRDDGGRARSEGPDCDDIVVKTPEKATTAPAK